MFQTEELIVDWRLRQKGTKTAFYGFGYLKKITSLNDISNYKI